MQLIKIIEKKGACTPRQLALGLGISSQALHRHLRDLIKSGLLQKIGSAPRVQYARAPGSPKIPIPQFLSPIGEILGSHPAVRLVCLFGSYARGEQNSNSDIDILVWLGPEESFDRKHIWDYWDRQAHNLPWKDKVSILVKRLGSVVSIDTLLLDMPEEHLCLHDPNGLFPRLRNAVIDWRVRNRSKKLPSFGGKHAWCYSTQARTLSEINFGLEIGDVA